MDATEPSTNKKDKRPLDVRELLTFILVFLLTLPICMVLTQEGLKYAHNRESEHLALRSNIFEDLVNNEGWVISSAEEWYDRSLSATVQLMTDSLRELVTDEGYTGPRMLADGFVLSFEGDRAILPEELSAAETTITRKLVEESVSAGRMRTGRLTKPVEIRPVSPLLPAIEAETDESVAYYLSFGRIAGDLYYADMTSEAEVQEYMSRYESIDYDALEQADKLFNGNTVLVGERDGHIVLLKTYGKIDQYKTLEDLGITEAQVRDEAEMLKINGVSYTCIYFHPSIPWEDAENVTIIQMLPVVSLGMRSLNRALSIVCTMLLSFVTILVFLYAVKRHVREAVLTRRQAWHYDPHRLCLRMINAALVSAIVVFVISITLQGLGQIYVEVMYGQDTLDMVVREAEQATTSVEGEDDRQQGEWYVYYGERMASLLSMNPGFATQERLQRWCDILNIDFIMLFDNEGQQTLCNRDYSGFTLNKGLGANTSDFKRLLLGIPSIVHETSRDETTGLDRQIVGVTLPMTDGSHGALIMALLPGQIQRFDRDKDPNEQLAAMTMDDAECFIVNEPSRVVIYTSELALQGAKILERGLSERSLRDGYMDFGAVDGEDCLILTQRSGESIFYYAVKCDALFKSLVKYGGMAAGIYALVAAGILLSFFLGYTKKYFSEYAIVADSTDGTPTRWDRPDEGSENDGEPVMVVGNKYSRAAQERLLQRLEKSKTKNFWKKLLDIVHWDEKRPEDKAGLVFRVCLVLLLMICGNLVMNTNLVSKGYGSVANFLMHGDWVRGANLFAVCSVAMVIGAAYLITVVSTLVLSLLSNFLTGKGQTICKLILSAIKYLAVFVSIYLALTYFGFPIGTVVGSIGIVSLAVSLGAQDMAADILAGLSILFEKSFEVGDIVQIGSEKGMVQEIGVRTTKLLTSDNNLMTINNHSIDTIVNLTRNLSWYSLEVHVPLDAPVEEIEALLNRELPEIGKRCESIVGELSYNGISNFGGKGSASSITMVISVQCDEKELYNVSYFVNREVLLLFRNHGIKLL